MKSIIKFILSLALLTTTIGAWASNPIPDATVDLRKGITGTTGRESTLLTDFLGPIEGYFFGVTATGADGINGAFVEIAFQIKWFFLVIAVLFLIYGIIRLLFSSADEEKVKQWKSNLIWVSVGIIVMQIAFGVWNTMIIRTTTGQVNARLGYDIWMNIFQPLVNLLQMLASFGFLFMAVYAFFTIVGGGGDEEKLKKGKNIITYALIGFFLIKFPRMIISSIYGSPNCKQVGPLDLVSVGTCAIEQGNYKDSIGLIGKIVNYFNSFLAIICVLLIIYAGFLIFTSGGDEEKMKKAKNIIIYIIVGLVILVGSHALFNFFILKG